jgi:hypothetical protein
VPVLYQEQQDPQVVTTLLPQAVRQLQDHSDASAGGRRPCRRRVSGRSRNCGPGTLHTDQPAVVRGKAAANHPAVEPAGWPAPAASSGPPSPA